MVNVFIFEEYRPGYTTGKETGRVPVKTFKDAFAYLEQERAKAWEPMRAKLNWWEIKDKRVALPNNGQWRRWAIIKKIQ